MVLNVKLSTHRDSVKFPSNWEPLSLICLEHLSLFTNPDGWYAPSWGVILWI